MNYIYSDGGRKKSGYKGSTNDCVVRAVAIATNRDYKDVYKELYDFAGQTPRLGVLKKMTRKYITEELGFNWHPTMIFGKGCRVHLNADELPSGVIICSLSKHITCVIDGVIHDTYDPSRDGRRCVYGYYSK